MSPEQQGLLISLISLALVFISPVISFLSYRRDVKKDEESRRKDLEDRFDSMKDSMNELTSAINLLNQKIEQMNKDVEENRKTEEGLVSKVNEHSTELADHEVRLNYLEKRK